MRQFLLTDIDVPPSHIRHMDPDATYRGIRRWSTVCSVHSARLRRLWVVLLAADGLSRMQLVAS